ncbi:hypothetical protein LOTGIDRAFT_239536 [Lottia gigantea]|uniref:Uncharacterized protein n=1 Tax=Lottia gigantea TaxID=225164 RepID=V3ZRN9_LOTGI|nr:hypothetical protein LOTGIDRAFT_239536 [Lottia gigantea]ESO94088.1 hypothetical protein LOTGIDRAFT_239536 [Lottia gigantea]
MAGIPFPMEGFKYSSSSSATDNMVRYGVQPRFSEVYTDRASLYRNKVLMVWHGSSSWFQEQSSWSLATTGHLNWEVNQVMVEHKCPKGDSWNEARCKQKELHYIEIKCLWCGTEVRKVR